MMKQQFLNRRFFMPLIFTIWVAFLLSACGKPQNQSEYVTILTNSPEEQKAAIYTEVAKTFYAQVTETALAIPSETPTATATFTATATITQTPTSTSTPKPAAVYVWVPTLGPSSTPLTVTPSVVPTAADYGCVITSQSIADGTAFSPNEEFDASWTIKNTGKLNWDASEIDYRYVSGTSMHKYNAVYDLPASVNSGNSITITVDMKAPSSAANYETFWGISKASTTLCTLPLRIKVSE